MRLILSESGFCFRGKVSELRQLLHPWSQSNATLYEFISIVVH